MGPLLQTPSRNHPGIFAALRKVQPCEFAVVFFGCLIVCLCGVEFGCETAEPEAFAIDPDFGGPFAGAFFEIDADVLGGGFGSDFSPVAGIFRVGSEAEIRPAVVEGSIISMVDDEAGRRGHNHPVHTYHFSFSGADYDVSEGVKFFSVSAEVPIEIFKQIVISRLDNRPNAFAEGNSAKGVAELQLAIKQ
jgi:hypothetical protein